jgi:hypothetical protein
VLDLLRNLGRRRKPAASAPEAPEWRREGFSAAHFYTAAFQSITITVRQVPPSEIQDYCGPGALACYDPNRRIITIPRIFHDAEHEKFHALGEELWHALGGHHHG